MVAVAPAESARAAAAGSGAAAGPPRAARAETVASAFPDVVPEPVSLPRQRAVAREPDRRWALVIGIDEYPGASRDLLLSAADARDTARALVRRLGFPRRQVRVLLNGEATAAAIRRSARWLASRTGEGGTSVLFYAGHAVQLRHLDGDREDVDEAILAADGRLVPDGVLAGALEGSAGRMWLVVAACHGAGFRDALAPGRVLTAASAENDLAYESDALGNSFLVEYVVGAGLLANRSRTAEAAFRTGLAAMPGAYARHRPLQLDRVAGPLSLVTP